MRLAWFLSLTVTIVGAPTAARAQSAAPRDAEAAYEQEAVGVRRLISPLRDGTTVDEQGQLLYTGKWDAFAARDHHPIEDDAFFRIVGRDDLALRYHRRAMVKQTLTAGGWLLVVGGAVATFLAVAPRGEPVNAGGSSSPYLFNPAWSLGVMGAGLASAIIGHFLDPTPIDADEADRLARSYDQSLSARLGLSETASRQ